MSEPHTRQVSSAKGATVRRLVRRARQAALSTTMAGTGTRSDSGAPFCSLVTLATDPAGAPVLLLSRLAEHTRNLTADPRAALMIADPAESHVNPQEDARVTLMGELIPDPDPILRARFLARHPYAEMYADFADFRFFRMAVHRAHMVGGFGQAGWVEGAAALMVPEDLAEALTVREADLCRRLGTVHAADLSRVVGPGAWRVAALDADGLDVVPDTTEADCPAVRLPFPRPLTDPADLDAAFHALVAEAS
jgi:putative heme iron utilization protein